MQQFINNLNLTAGAERREDLALMPQFINKPNVTVRADRKGDWALTHILTRTGKAVFQ